MATTAAQDEFNNLMRDKSRLSRHPSDVDNSDTASFLHDDSDNEDDTATTTRAASLAASQTTNRPGTYKIPTTRHQSNTGPKGVITDAQAYRDAARSARPSTSASRSSFQTSSYPSPPQQHWNKENTPRHSIDESRDGGGDNVDDDDGDAEVEDDEDFMATWRAQRLAQLSGAGKTIGGKRRERDAVTRTRFGGIVPVDGTGFLEAVDGSGSTTAVLVYIWDDTSEVSQMVEDCLAVLARKYISTRFVKLHYRDAEMEPAGVPAILAYRGGEKFAGLVPIVDAIPDDADLSASTLERVMQRQQML